VRIAVISPAVDRQHGTERAVAELVNRLAAQYKDEIELYAQSVSDINFNQNSAAQARESGETIWHRVSSFGGPHLIEFLGWLLMNRFTRWRQERTSGKTPDVIFSPGINAFDADVILVHAIFHRVAELQKAHDDPGGLRGLHRKLYYSLICSLERRVYTNPRVTLAAVSRHTAEQLARYFRRNDVSVIPNGVDGDHFSPASIATMRDRSRQVWKFSTEDFVLLLIGNDWRNKGLKTLLRACSACKDLPIRLLVVGQDEQAPFRVDAKNLGLANRVQFFAPVQDVRIFYAAADALAAPSLEDSFNLPVLEAMSCGLPVIASQRAGVSDWLTDSRDSVVLKNPEDAQELSKMIRSLASNTSFRSTIAANGVHTARKFSWDAHTSELRKLMAKAAQEKSRHSLANKSA
jgi:UDP-glucose:(heptosyl)LPS alpha-1,3-glucosyltransferase